MNKLFKKISLLLLSFLMIVVSATPIFADSDMRAIEHGYYPEDSEPYLNASETMKDMLDLQNKITLSLSIEGEKYIYDSQVIESIISEFDFETFNLETKNNYTKMSFLSDVITNIDDIKLSAMQTFAYTTGPMCGVTKTDTIWNSRREYRPVSTTNNHINRLRQDANTLNAAWGQSKVENTALLMALYVLYPGLKWAVLAGGAIKSVPVFWMKGVANSLQSSNYNGCGTVLDVNMVSVYSSWNQLKN